MKSLSLAVLSLLLSADAALADAYAFVYAGNYESPLGNDLDEGQETALASTSDTDPQYGTAAAIGNVDQHFLGASGIAASFAGPAWVASSDTSWFGNMVITFPIAAVNGLPENLLVEFTADFDWHIEFNGSYTVGMQDRSASYSTQDGQQQDDFGNIVAGQSGTAVLSASVPFDSLEIDPLNINQYRGEVGVSMRLNAITSSGDHSHGSWPSTSVDAALEMTDFKVFDGSTEIDIDFSYEFEVLTADFDDDGDVDGRDFLLWQRGYGILSDATLSDGDSNEDGDVDADDLAVWQDQYGETGHLSGFAAVPEPAALMLLCVGAVSACCQRVR